MTFHFAAADLGEVWNLAKPTGTYDEKDKTYKEQLAVRKRDSTGKKVKDPDQKVIAQDKKAYGELLAMRRELSRDHSPYCLKPVRVIVHYKATSHVGIGK